MKLSAASQETNDVTTLKVNVVTRICLRLNIPKTAQDCRLLSTEHLLGLTQVMTIWLRAAIFSITFCAAQS